MTTAPDGILPTKIPLDIPLDIPPAIPLPDWTPRPPVTHAVLEGRWCRLEPLAPGHGDDLYEASTSPDAGGPQPRFQFLFEEPPTTRADFDAWLAGACVSQDPLFVAVVDAASGRAQGRQAFMRMVPAMGVVEIGSIMWGPAIRRSRVATEALYLTARHAFETLGYRRLEWKCDTRNLPSRRAALRFGFAFEGIFRQAVVYKGRNRDTAWFAITDGDWAVLGPEFERWLAPENFDADGVQRTALRCRDLLPDPRGR